MSDDELKLTRRFFLRQSAIATAMGGGMYCISQKTDALADDDRPVKLEPPGDGFPYPYHNG